MKNLQLLIQGLIALILPVVGLLGGQALNSVEKMVTIPKTDLDKLCAGMSTEDKAEARELAQKMADSVSDLAVFVASRGTIQPD